MITAEADRPTSSSGESAEYFRTLGTEEDRRIVGGKAAALSQLIRHGLPVPPGFVITADAIIRTLEASGATVADPGHLDETLVIPESLLDAVMDRLQQMNVDTVAVRSSAVDEDSRDRSFAGQYESVLSVPTDDRHAVADAIRRVWRSLCSEHANAYRSREEQAASSGIAVILQEMVDADLAGVLFTVDPVSNDRNAMVVNLVRGLGNKLVDGSVTPEERRFGRDGSSAIPSVDSSLIESGTLNRLRSLALQIEEIGGGPQDIEFAVAGSDVRILQARPITTLPTGADGSDSLQDVEPIPIDIEVPESGFWELSSKDFQRPVTPLTSDIYYPMMSDAIARFFGEFGILLDGMEYRDIGGHPYTRMIPPGGKDGAPPPPFLMKILFRVVPSLRAKRKAARRAEEENLADLHVEKWYKQDRPALLEQLNQFRSRDRSVESDDGLIALLEEAQSWMQNAIECHFMTLPAHFLAVSDLYTFNERHFGWPKEKISHMISGISDETSAGTGILCRMARLATDRCGATPTDVPALERLRDSDEEFDALYREYVDRCGLTLRGYDLDASVAGENSTAVLEQVLTYVTSGYDHERVVAELDRRREELEREAIAAADELGEERGAELRRTLDALETAMPVRDDTGLVAVRAMGAIRLVALEIGSRLAERSLIESPEHVVYLTMAEIAESLRDGTARSALVARRRGQRKWAEMNPGPASYGTDPGDPPKLETLPREMHRIMGGLLWLIQNDLSPAIPDDEEGGINGIGASPGVVVGRVAVRRDVSNLGEIRPGEILVCPVTTPAWAEVFPVIGGIISDFGGILSHPAIIAREFGVPAVVGTGSGTATLRDGDLVRLDGGSGRVEILESGGGESQKRRGDKQGVLAPDHTSRPG